MHCPIHIRKFIIIIIGTGYSYIHKCSFIIPLEGPGRGVIGQASEEENECILLSYYTTHSLVIVLL